MYTAINFQHKSEKIYLMTLELAEDEIEKTVWNWWLYISLFNLDQIYEFQCFSINISALSDKPGKEKL